MTDLQGTQGYKYQRLLYLNFQKRIPKELDGIQSLGDQSLLPCQATIDEKGHGQKLAGTCQIQTLQTSHLSPEGTFYTNIRIRWKQIQGTQGPAKRHFPRARRSGKGCLSLFQCWIGVQPPEGPPGGGTQVHASFLFSPQHFWCGTILFCQPVEV